MFFFLFGINNIWETIFVIAKDWNCYVINVKFIITLNDLIFQYMVSCTFWVRWIRIFHDGATFFKIFFRVTEAGRVVHEKEFSCKQKISSHKVGYGCVIDFTDLNQNVLVNWNNQLLLYPKCPKNCTFYSFIKK